MATNMFGNYFNNPTKSYIYANLTCNGASADEMSFDIRDSASEISTNSEVLSSLGLEDVHVPCTQYTRDMKILEPYSIIYVKGAAHGESYTRKAYGCICPRVLEIEQWQYLSTVKFHLKYTDDYGIKRYKCVTASSVFDAQLSFLDSCQSLLDKAKIPIQVSYADGYIIFTATTAGFDFWIPKVELISIIDREEFTDVTITEDYDNPINYADSRNATASAYNGQNYVKVYAKTVRENQIQDEDTDWFENDMPYYIDTKFMFNSFLFEDIHQYIPPVKYRNGAMKGVVLTVTYPQYNAENIEESQLSLKIGHLTDRVEDYYTNRRDYASLPYFIRVLYDVVDTYSSQYDVDNYMRWARNPASYDINYLDDWIEPDEPVIPCRPPRPKPPCPPVFDSDWQKPSEEPDRNDDGWNEPVLPGVGVCPPPEPVRDEWEESTGAPHLSLCRMYQNYSKYEVIGLYGYANYLTKHNLWKNIGQLYAVTATEDDPSGKTRNLIDSFIIYNPNPFPVVVNYLTFA